MSRQNSMAMLGTPQKRRRVPVQPHQKHQQEELRLLIFSHSRVDRKA
nr:hypothetical protein [Mariniblastus sp.]